MDKADVVVIKTDYMAHAQWYKVIERSRKLKKRVVSSAEIVLRNCL